MNFKGFSVLKTITEEFGADFIKLVVVASDKSVQNDYCSEITEYCGTRGINCLMRNEQINVTTNYAFAIGWRWIIQHDKNTRLIILHDSLLPRNRGYNPMVTSLINGDTKIGVTALFASEKYDAGPIIGQEEFEIKYPCKIQEAIEMSRTSYCNLIKKICTSIKDGKILKSRVQDEKKATYSLWRDDEDYRIDWNGHAEKIERFINAVGYPYLGASTILNDSVVRIDEAEAMQEVIIENRVAGKVIRVEDSFPVVVCGAGLLKIKKMRNEDGVKVELKKFRSRFK